jgi:PBSX family phage terminase large subunit
MQLKLLKCYTPFRKWQGRYVQLIGGYGSGKSFHAVWFMLEKMLTKNNVRFLMVRNTIKAVSESIWQQAKDIVHMIGIESYIKFLKNPYRIIVPSTNSMAIAFGCMEGSNSEFGSLTKGKKGIAEITDALIDEADEIPEYFFDLIDGRCRSPLSNAPNQIIMCYNPPIKQNWIPKRWFDEGRFMPEFKTPYVFETKSKDARTGKEIVNETLVIRTNYLHNKLLPAKTVAIYEDYKNTNYDMYLAGVKAEWGTKFRGIYFTPAGYREGVIPDNIRGVIYCDPNLAKKKKGDTTAIVKVGTDGYFIYIKDVYVRNTEEGTDLAQQILLMQVSNETTCQDASKF